jgi:flotillin
MDIRDALGSTVIENMMAKEQSRIDQESRVTVAENHRIAAEAEIEAQRSVDVQQQEALQQVGIRTAKKDEEVGIAMELSKQKVQQEAAQTAEKQMAVQKVNETRAAEIAQSVTVVDAEAYKQSTTLRAEADLAATQNQAKGIEAKGVAEGKAETAKLMAPVTAQITLADKIGGDDGYQNYLIKVREVEAGEAVGRSMADAIGNGDLKIIANGGSVSEGTSNLGKLFGLDMGTNLTGLITALSQTDEGKALVEKVVGKPKTEPVEQTSL